MKRLFSFVLIATAALNLSALPNLSAQWVKQSPYPTNLDLYTVAFTSPTHGFVGGQNSEWDTGGGLWETLEDGSTWTQRDVPMSSSDPINTLFFFDNELVGFGIRLRVSGDRVRRSWIAQYRSRGRTRRILIGSVEKVAPPDARKAATGTVNSTFSNPSAASTAMRRPCNLCSDMSFSAD